MKYIAFACFILISAVMPANAAKDKKKTTTITEAEYLEIRRTYHHICDEIHNFEFNVDPSEVEKWCSAVSRVMRKTGHLPSFAPEKVSLQKEKAPLKKKSVRKKSKKRSRD